MRARHEGPGGWRCLGPGTGSLQPAEDSFRQRRARGGGGTCGLERDSEGRECFRGVWREQRVESETSYLTTGPVSPYQ